MRIGYQGDVGSNAEAAASIMSVRLGSVDLIPLTSSMNVMGALKTGEIDLGVFAMANNIGGIVEETSVALANEKLTQTDSVTMEIHHCVFMLDGVDVSDIDLISSHPQAFAQCTEYLKREFPNVRLDPVADTALSAQMLSDGRLGRDTAVMCRRNAGEMYGLKLYKENVENAVSLTQFSMFSLSDVPLGSDSHALL